MVRILVILGGLGYEGITNSVLTYLETIEKNEIELHLGVAGMAEPEAMERAKKINISIHMLPGRNRQPIQYFIALKKLVQTNKFDIVHVHGNSATLGIDMLAAKLGGAPVRIAHSRNTSCTHPKMDKMMRPVFNSTYTHGFACGVEAGKWLFGSKPFTVIPNGKNIDRFIFNNQNRNEVRSELHIEDKIVLGHAGVFNEQKNHIFLIDIFYDLCKYDDKYLLCLFGVDGGKLPEIEQKVKSLGLTEKVKFLGFKKDVERYLSAMDIMLFPSLYEGLPNVVIEWQISGLPCVLSDKITNECCIMDNVKFLPIDQGTYIWTEYIRQIAIPNRESKENEIRVKISDAGFDIKKNVARLRELYIELGKKEKK